MAIKVDSIEDWDDPRVGYQTITVGYPGHQALAITLIFVLLFMILKVNK